MDICLLIWSYRPGLEGGSERQARLVAGELAKRGWDCEVWTALQDGAWPTEDQQDGVVVRRFGPLASWALRGQRRLERFHRMIVRWLLRSAGAAVRYDRLRRRLDFWCLLPWVWLARRSFMKAVLRHARTVAKPPRLVHLHEPSWLGGFAMELGDLWRVPVVCQEATHPALPAIGYDTPDRGVLNRRRQEPLYLAMAPFIAEELAAKGIPGDRLALLPNAVRIPGEPAAPGRNRFVLYVGNFSQGAHWKAFDVLFQAWVLVHQQDPGARLVVLGGGDRTVWEDFVQQSGCAESVGFIGRVDDPGLYYRDAAMLVLPSRVEGMSNALLEAQSWGLPCVVSDVPGNRAVVTDGVNGIVVPVGEAGALAAGIGRLLASAEERTRMGEAARRRAIETYSVPVVLDRLIGLYEGVAGSLRGEPQVALRWGRVPAKEGRSSDCMIEKGGV